MSSLTQDERGERKFTYLYALVRKSDKQLFYIGKSNNPTKRKSQHKDEALAYRKASRVYAFIRKLLRMGDDFEVVKLAKVEYSLWELFEQRAISAFRKAGYNLRNIAEGGRSPEITEATRAKLSLINKGKKLSEEHRQKLSEAHKGKATWNKGRKFGSNPNSPMKNPEVVARVIATRRALGHYAITEESRAKMRAAKLGRSLSTKPVQQIDLITGNVVAVYENPSLAAIAVNAEARGSEIRDCANGKRKTVRGYKWRWVTK